jgi:hypothetical protein
MKTAFDCLFCNFISCFLLCEIYFLTSKGCSETGLKVPREQAKKKVHRRE